MSNKDIETKVTDIVTTANNAQNIKAIVSMELIGFLQSTIDRVKKKNTLRELIEESLMNDLVNTDEEMPLGAKIKLLEILTKNEADATTPILKVIESAIKPTAQEAKQNESSGNSETQKDSIITQENINEAKKGLELLSAINRLRESEFGEKEKK